MNLQPHYYPALCRKCGDVTQCLRSPLMHSLKVGHCGRRERNGAPCRGDVYFIQSPLPIETKPKAKPIVVTSGLEDIVGSARRPYPLTDEEMRRERPDFAVNDLDPAEVAQLDQLGQQDSWGEEEAST